MREVGRDVERKAVQRHPAAHADPDRADLGLAALRVVGPDADPAFGAARGNDQRGSRVDDPAFERMDIGPPVPRASPPVVTDVGDACRTEPRRVGNRYVTAGLTRWAPCTYKKQYMCTQLIK